MQSSRGNREMRRSAIATRAVRSTSVKIHPQDRSADTVVLPQDELAGRRLIKQLRHLTPSQIQRLALAFELRERAARRGIAIDRNADCVADR